MDQDHDTEKEIYRERMKTFRELLEYCYHFLKSLEKLIPLQLSQANALKKLLAKLEAEGIGNKEQGPVINEK